MSWDAYVDNIIGHAGNEHIDRAAIFGMDGNSWTATAPKTLKLSAEEGKVIADAVNRGEEAAKSYFGANGVRLEGVKYQFLRIDEDVILAKKKGSGAISIQKTKQAFVVGHCPEGKQQGNCNKAISVVADYLIGIGY